MFKKLFIFITLCLTFTSFTKLKASDGIKNTGHKDMLEIGFYDDQYRLVFQYDQATLTKAYDDVSSRAFGWSAVTLIDGIYIWYISDCIISRSNNTRDDITIKYDTSFSKTETLTHSIGGSVAAKMSGKVKGVTAGVDATIKGEVSKQIKNYYEESIVFTLKIAPGKKVSLLVRGDATISNGVSKYYFLGIPFKKGTWEVINVETEYYELYEEDL